MSRKTPNLYVIIWRSRGEPDTWKVWDAFHGQAWVKADCSYTMHRVMHRPEVIEVVALWLHVSNEVLADHWNYPTKAIHSALFGFDDHTQDTLVIDDLTPWSD